MPIRREGIIQGSGCWMLRCKLILDRQGPGPGRTREGADQRAVGAQRSEDETATVQIEQDRLTQIWRLQPGGIYGMVSPRQLDGAARNPVRPKRTEVLTDPPPPDHPHARHDRPRTPG